MSAALADRDPTIRVWASSRLGEAGAGLAELATRSLRDSLGTIRLRALQLALEHGIAVELEPFLTDSHAGVRSLAQAALLLRDVDVVSHYRSLLLSSDGRRLAAAVSGLVESGGSDVEPEVRRFVRHHAPAVRRAALHVFGALAVEDIGTLCLEALSDPSPGVTHAARDLLVRRRPACDPVRLWAALEAAPTTHGQLDALAVLGELDYWERLPHILCATRLSAALRTRAVEQLRKWIALQGRRFTVPSRATVASIRHALAAAMVDPAIRDEIGRVVAHRAAVR